MVADTKFVVAYTLLGLVIALWIRSETIVRKPLPSLRVNPSDLYTEDFFPNGRYLELPMGTMRYWLLGDPAGKRVVMIHGISTGSPSYDKLARYMVNICDAIGTYFDDIG